LFVPSVLFLADLAAVFILRCAPAFFALAADVVTIAVSSLEP
jgi:hypothetical protein